MKSLLYVSASAIGIYTGVCIYKENEKFYKDVLMPLVHLLDPEQAHKLAVFVSRHRLIPKSQHIDSEILVKAVPKLFMLTSQICHTFSSDPSIRS